MSRVAILRAWGIALAAGLGCTAASALAQSTASPFTSATRYDVQNRVTGTIAPDPDAAGTLHHLAVRNTYDVNGRLIRVEKGELSSWQGESVLPSAWSGFTPQQKVETDYDLLDRKVKESVFGWNAGTSSWDPASQVTQYSYDAVGRLECTAVRMNPAEFGSLPPSACMLGTAGNQVPDRITKQFYDDAGQLLKVQRAMGTSLQQDYVTYTYTDNGKQEYVTDANGNKARLVYDGHDRQSQWQFPSAVSPGTVNTNDREEYAYDLNGNRESWRKRDGRVFTFTYDALNRVSSKLVPTACVAGYACTNVAASSRRNVFYSYDVRGHQTAARFDSAVGSDAVTSTYDGFGRQTSSTTAMGGVSRTIGSTYDANGNRMRVIHPDNSFFHYYYDGLDRPIEIRENNGTVVASMSWNEKGFRAGETRGVVATDYGYDPVQRLNSLSDDLAGTAHDVTTTLGYNPASQITLRSRTNPAYAFTGYTSANRSYTPNGLNQYANVAGVSYGYDSNGNLTSNGASSYTYDPENRLVVTSAGASLMYDPLGRLYQTSGGSAGITQFLYDGDQLALEYGGSNNLLRRYVHGTGEDDPLLWYEGWSLADRRSLQVDHQGSIVSVATAGGSASEILTFDEYGTPGANAYGSRFQYTGQIYIPELAMYHYKARIYSPRLGRFLQTDPIGYDDQINLYAYVTNDPMNHTDPAGIDGQDLWGRVVDVTVGTIEVITGGAGAGAGIFITGVSIAAEVPSGGTSTVGVVGGVTLTAGGTALAAHGSSRIVRGLTGKAKGATISEARRSGPGPYRCSNPTCDDAHGGTTGTTECPDCAGKRAGGKPLPGPKPRTLPPAPKPQPRPDPKPKRIKIDDN